MSNPFDDDPPPAADPDLDAVEAALYSLDPTGNRVATVLRDTFDQLYDGQRTGRWNFDDHLRKTERTHMGTIVEINLHREFDFEDGTQTDYRIADVQVDCKYSMRPFGWNMPPEVVGHLALVVHANEATCSWRAGLIRVKPEYLRGGQNRDSKKELLASARKHIRWLWQDHGRLPPNLFYELNDETRDAIFGAKAKRGNQHGQARLNELFRLVQGRTIRRAELATVGQQDDFMKRARNNGGSRTYLRPEGIIVLGHQGNDPLVAASLGLPVPRKGELVAARVVQALPGRSDPTAEICGQLWAVARPGDAVVPAPEVGRGGA
ncbi:NaeI family type II restriction endonuclease [Mycolicibacterium neoaurum]|uniref:NaeI family type II restriction endonuclease n=1 Tax=Mycolicibacterium neoaurum TaxID=1795 RepID=UPI00248CE5EB|nr:NaeI family type II restriction endonuclease [Mycolicibacterium neoaurum]WBP93200.1 NaeI family type II restriction endonuclease [Mycolicibacterium neoaurum]WBS06833.1 NaeI family type II restriction endonuclease [Mycolicibacterium neoaurum]